MDDSVKDNKPKATLVTVKMEDKAKLLPTKPGCYLMKNKDQQIIYVGKAKNLRSRVTSYFNSSSKNAKTEILVSHIVDFDFIMTTSDAESFVLENTLIKKHTPKYNIRLKDDKSYPYVVINHNEPFPRLEFIRRVKRGKGIEVFGPFVTGSNVWDIIRILTQSFCLRDCTLTEFRKRKEPCLLYQMHQCSAPCVGKIDASEYEKDMAFARDMFSGSGSKTLKELEHRMARAAENEEFEKAALIRDNMSKLGEFANNFKQENAEHNDEKNLDIVAYYQGENEVDISIYMMRNGVLLGHKNFNFSNLDIVEEVEDSVLNYLFQYYANTYDSLPQLIITQMTEESNGLLQAGIETLDKNIRVRAPQKKYESFLNLTRDHAFEQQRVRLLHEDSVYVGLNKLKDLLGLKERPVVLECYDVAVFQGSSPTASQIVFHDGKPDKKNYRYYHMEERPEGNNDFAMMRELIIRRSDNGSLPDVFIVDGGLGQVNIFKEALKELNIPIPVVGIAKSKNIRTKEGFRSEDIKKSEERLIIPGRSNPFFLNQNRSLFKIIVQMRDEAHRFSRKLHHKEETKRVFNKKVPRKKKDLTTGKERKKVEIELDPGPEE
ncbi:excinuclease ABC subunit UvrC [Bacteriovorax sp. PP10]|uniref:UvrABC system protein C n=1 Tax=Bacteriovorax antarcticus TaxID=3088717 RepID=A0ABU5VQU8_9BACT|nr:excinuclease ABC subunit UvrC [Bacteriovorax sp. PP10]MEA9355423.1 excinuclease ABC subunit UvrC [Bacteriovorax sp. PP10]